MRLKGLCIIGTQFYPKSQVMLFFPLRCGFNELFVSKNVNIKYLPDTFFFSPQSELWTVLKISFLFPGEFINCKRWQIGRVQCP